MTTGSRDSNELAKRCARLLDSQKFDDIKVFDVRASFQLADCFLIASGRNVRHLKAASTHLLTGLRDIGVLRRGVEGTRESGWMLIDLDDVVVHLFLPDNRRFYDLEVLWGDSPSVEWETSAGPQELAVEGEASQTGSDAQPGTPSEDDPPPTRLAADG